MAGGAQVPSVARLMPEVSKGFFKPKECFNLLKPLKSLCNSWWFFPFWSFFFVWMVKWTLAHQNVKFIALGHLNLLDLWSVLLLRQLVESILWSFSCCFFFFDCMMTVLTTSFGLGIGGIEETNGPKMLFGAKFCRQLIFWEFLVLNSVHHFFLFCSG